MKINLLISNENKLIKVTVSWVLLLLITMLQLNNVLSDPKKHFIKLKIMIEIANGLINYISSDLI